jgi:hypothetical protein
MGMDTEGKLEGILAAFDDEETKAKLQASLALIFKVETKQELDIIVQLCRMIYVIGALNVCKSAVGEDVDEIAEELGQVWERLYWWHTPGGNA